MATPTLEHDQLQMTPKQTAALDTLATRFRREREQRERARAELKKSEKHIEFLGQQLERAQEQVFELRCLLAEEHDALATLRRKLDAGK